MESTGDYWRPFYYVLETDLEVMLVNAHDVRNVPGRKTDVSDAAWLADLGAHGSSRASFVPPEPIRQLRDLTRARTLITRERGPGDPTVGEAVGIRRDQTVLGGHRHHRGIRPVDAAALIDGPPIPPVMADLAKRRMRSKIPVLTEALNGRFTAHHAFMTRCSWTGSTRTPRTSPNSSDGSTS